MSGCTKCNSPHHKFGPGEGPFATGRKLVEFVYNAHDGALRDEPIDGGGFDTICQGCGAAFVLKTHVGKCPSCGGVHAIAPVHRSAEHIQYAGKDFNIT